LRSVSAVAVVPERTVAEQRTPGWACLTAGDLAIDAYDLASIFEAGVFPDDKSVFIVAVVFFLAGTVWS
jgi:hypothetical protein